MRPFRARGRHALGHAPLHYIIIYHHGARRAAGYDQKKAVRIANGNSTARSPYRLCR